MSESDSRAKYGATNPRPETLATMPVKRFGAVIGLNAEKEEYYRELHANAWPGIVDRIHKSSIRNFSIYITEIEGKKYMFSYFEYIGDDIESDMQDIADDPETQRWWKETNPCQFQLPTRRPGQNWSAMEMIFLVE